MIHNCYIDGVDVRAAYGVWITKGGYDGLFALPEMKPPKLNDWPEMDGIEVDLKSPKLRPQYAALDFCASGEDADAPGFVNFLARPGYRSISLPYLRRQLSARLTQTPDMSIWPSVTSFKVELAIDAPARPALFAWLAPGVRITPSAYRLDGALLSDFGIFVREGRDSLTRPAAVKPNLTRDISVMDGQLYDAGAIYLNSRETTLKCCLKAESPEALWSCYDALFARLIQPGERTLTYKGVLYPVFYRSITGARLVTMRRGFVMIEFDLNLTVIR